MKRFLIGCLATYGTLDLLVRTVPLLLTYLHSGGPPSDVKMDIALLSPDGLYKVIEFASFGGGGISPYCSYVFSVVPADVPDRLAWRGEDRVADFGCPGLKAGGIGHGVTWTDDHRLRIRLDLNDALQDGRVLLKRRDATRQVVIDYTTL